MSMINMNTNAVVTESVPMLMVHILIDRKEILLQVLQNEEVMKGVLMVWTHAEPQSIKLSMKPHTYLLMLLVYYLRRLGLLLKRLRIGWVNQRLSHVMS